MHYQHLRHWRRLLLALLVAGLLLPAHGTHAQAADPNIITVNSTADAPDADPADGQCAAANQLSAQACTLRAAIMHANATPGTQTIELPVNTYTLTIRNTGELGDAQ